MSALPLDTRLSSGFSSSAAATGRPATPFQPQPAGLRQQRPQPRRPRGPDSAVAASPAAPRRSSLHAGSPLSPPWGAGTYLPPPPSGRAGRGSTLVRPPTAPTAAPGCAQGSGARGPVPTLTSAPPPPAPPPAPTPVGWPPTPPVPSPLPSGRVTIPAAGPGAHRHDPGSRGDTRLGVLVRTAQPRGPAQARGTRRPRLRLRLPPSRPRRPRSAPRGRGPASAGSPGSHPAPAPPRRRLRRLPLAPPVARRRTTAAGIGPVGARRLLPAAKKTGEKENLLPGPRGMRRSCGGGTCSAPWLARPDPAPGGPSSRPQGSGPRRGRGPGCLQARVSGRSEPQHPHEEQQGSSRESQVRSSKWGNKPNGSRTQHSVRPRGGGFQAPGTEDADNPRGRDSPVNQGTEDGPGGRQREDLRTSACGLEVYVEMAPTHPAKCVKGKCMPAAPGPAPVPCQPEIPQARREARGGEGGMGTRRPRS